MREFKGVRYIKENKYCMFFIDEFTDSMKNALREQLSTICHGEDKAAKSRVMYNYKNTVKEFLKRYEIKPDNIKIGMIGELVVHLLISNYFDEYKVVTPYFNMEERSIKKGYDVVLTEIDKPNIWLTEVKSGALHKDKTTAQTMIDLLGIAKRDLEGRLNEENETLWMEAINGAMVAFNSKNMMKAAIVDVLESWGDEAYNGIHTSQDKNIILSGVVFADNDDTITQKITHNKQQKIEKEKIFKEVYLIAVQKETYDKVYQFLKDEALDEE